MCCMTMVQTQDLALLPSHLHKSLRIRRTARMLIHERILSLSGIIFFSSLQIIRFILKRIRLYAVNVDFWYSPL